MELEIKKKTHYTHPDGSEHSTKRKAKEHELRNRTWDILDEYFDDEGFTDIDDKKGIKEVLKKDFTILVEKYLAARKDIFKIERKPKNV